MLIGALEAGGTKMVCSIGSPQGNVLQRTSFRTGTPDETIPQIADFFDKFDISALGVGSFGPLDLNPHSPTYGYITSSPKAAWRDFPICARLKEALGVPVAIDTDVNAAALAEHTMGAGKGYKSLVYITVGTGVGGGIVVNGEIVHGLIHPEVGHMIPAPNELDTMQEGMCPFHSHCLEGLASGPSIEKRWGLSPRLMMEDHPAWELEAEYLAQMCVNLIVILSPEVIVLGGGVMQQEHLFPRIRKHTYEMLGGYIASDRLTEEKLGLVLMWRACSVNL